MQRSVNVFVTDSTATLQKFIGFNSNIYRIDSPVNFDTYLEDGLSRLKGKFKFLRLKGAVGSADLKISKSALLSLNHHNFLNTKPIFTE